MNTDIVDAVDDPNGSCPTCYQLLRLDAGGIIPGRKARELLAKAYEKNGEKGTAYALRHCHPDAMRDDLRIALQAIEAALESP